MMDSLLAIYPTARKVEAVLKQQSRSRCALGHRSVTFPQLVDRIWRESREIRIPLSPLAERFALDQALRQNPGISFALTPGATAHLLGTIRELKSAAIAPDDLMRAAAALAPAQARRLRDLAQAFASYEALLARRGLADSHDREQLALGVLAHAEASGTRPHFLDGVQEVLVAEIYDFSVLQFMIVAALIRLVGDARLTIQAQPHRVDANRFAELTWNRFVAEESIADKVLPEFIRRGGRLGQLNFVIERVFSGDATPQNAPPPDGTVRIIEAPTPYREVEAVARAIRLAMEGDGATSVRPERIAVVARTLRPFAGYIRAIFRRYGIPVRIGEPQPAIAMQAGNFLNSLVRLPLGGYRRDAVEKLLCSPLISNRAGEYRDLPARVGYVDAATLPFADCADAYRLERSRDDPAFDRGARAVAELLAQIATLDPSGTVHEHCERIERLLAQIGFGRSERPPDGAQAMCFALREMARSADLAGADRALALDEFAALLETVLLDPAEHSAGEQSDGVQALSVIDARGLDFDLVFVIGLDDGIFPSYRSDDPRLPDELRIALNAPLAGPLRRRLGPGAPSVLGRLLRTRQDRNAEDALLFFLALSMTERAVVLSYAASDGNGNPLERSPFLDDVMQILGGNASVLQTGASSTGASVRDCLTTGEALNCVVSQPHLRARLTGAIGQSKRIESLERRIGIERQRERYLALPIREDKEDGTPDPRKLELADAYSGRVVPGALLRTALVGTSDAPKPLNPQSINELAACGFKFFSSQVLRLREADEPDVEVGAKEFGRIVHGVLRKVFERVTNFDDPSEALRAARRVLDEYRDHGPAARGDRAFYDIRWRNISKLVEEVVEFEARQWSASAGRELPLLEHNIRFAIRCDAAGFAAAEWDFEVQGRLDRLELHRNRGGQIDAIRLLDYKTSRSAARYAKLADPQKQQFGVTDFQLAIYLMGVLEEFRDELARDLTLEAGYLVLRSRDKLQSHPIDRDLIETGPRRRGEITARLAGLVNSAVSGHFDVDPLRCDDYCPYRMVCRYHRSLRSA